MTRLQKHNNKEGSKTMRNLTKPCINLSKFSTSISVKFDTTDNKRPTKARFGEIYSASKN